MYSLPAFTRTLAQEFSAMKTTLRVATMTVTAAGFFAGCSTTTTTTTMMEPRDAAPVNPIDVSSVPDAVPRAEPLSRYGNPESYMVYGKRYHTLPSSKGYSERGMASWYGTKFHGKRTSSGEPYDLYGMTAAHKTLPLPTYVEVTNLHNGRSVIVKVNDRGPFHDDRIIDLSYTAAAKLGILGHGTGKVEVKAIDTETGGRLQLATATPAVTETAVTQILYLQVGAFSSQENAERLRNEIHAQQIAEVRIVEGESTAGTVYKVQVGPLTDTSEADRVARALKPLGINESRSIVQ
jgi:rare lipoprotein A